LPGWLTYQARLKVTPDSRATDTHDRIRRDRVDTSGKITLRYQSPSTPSE
jgi:hypothetical protein